MLIPISSLMNGAGWIAAFAPNTAITVAGQRLACLWCVPRPVHQHPATARRHAEPLSRPRRVTVRPGSWQPFGHTPRRYQPA